MIVARGHYLLGAVPQHALADSSAIGQTRKGIAFGLFPQLSGVRFTHSWGGSVGVPRGWHPHVVNDTKSRLATAGGYIDEGVGASFLLGQMLAELLTEQQTERTQMPWLNLGCKADLRRWEPEPLSGLGVKATKMAFTAEKGSSSAPGTALSPAR